jgi:hypothetical protein
MRFIIAALIVIGLYSCNKDNDINVSNVNIEPSEVNLKVGGTQSLTFTITPENATDRLIYLLSRDTTIATIDNSGMVTAKSYGSTYVVGESSNGHFKDSCLVNVINKTDTVSMGAMSGNLSYPSDVYYSFANGIVKTVPRSNWDIAFKTNARSSSILINSTYGINLWEVPTQDTTAWGETKWTTTIDTIGMKGTWGALINSDTTWSLSAFERNATGHPDYGWGQYNSITHDVNGNSLFIIQLHDLSYKKIWIKQRNATTNTYIIKFANLDGSSSVNASINCSTYGTKNFVYYGLSTKEILDREPAADSWDIVLTRYLEMTSDGQTLVPYPVIGYLQNENTTVAQVSGNVESDSYEGATFLTAMNSIGSDWKTYSNSAYTITPDVKYFVKTKSSNIYKLVFKKFEGSSTGNTIFEKTKLK